MTLLLIMIAVLVVAILLRAPLAVGFTFSVVVAALVTGMPMASVVTGAFGNLQSFGLVALPLFIVLGFDIERGGLGEILLAYLELLLHRVKVAVPLITTLTSAIFGGVSGSATAAVAAVGTIMIPRGEQRGYRRGYLTGLVAVSSLLTLLIPPSLPMLVYALAANISIGAAFLTTVFPAVIIVLGYSVIHVVNARRGASWVYEGAPTAYRLNTETSWGSQVVRQTPKVLLIGAVPLAVLGSIYGGLASPTEAAALGVWMAFFLTLVVFRRLKPKSALTASKDAATLTGSLLLMLFAAYMFSIMIINEGIPFMVAEWLADAGIGRTGVLLILNGHQLVVGMVMDDISGSAFAASLFAPIALAAGVDPLHFAAIVGVNLGIGNLTPPAAPLAYLAGNIGKVPMREYGPTMLRFLLLVNIPVLLLVTYLPQLALWLPRSLGLMG